MLRQACLPDRQAQHRLAVMARVIDLKQPVEFLDRQPHMANYRSQCSAVQFFVIGNNDLGKGSVSAEYHVAPFLSLQDKPGLEKCSCAFPTRQPRQLAHTATSNASKRSSGTGR
jgi:hypothetical protein